MELPPVPLLSICRNWKLLKIVLSANIIAQVGLLLETWRCSPAAYLGHLLDEFTICLIRPGHRHPGLETWLLHVNVKIRLSGMNLN